MSCVCSVCMDGLFWPADLVCSSLSVLHWLFASYRFLPHKSYGQWDNNDLPLCEAFRQRDSLASPGSSCSSTQGDTEVVDGQLSQETNPQHHLNGHGTPLIEKPWWSKLNQYMSFHHIVFPTSVWSGFLLFCVADFFKGQKVWLIFFGNKKCNYICDMLLNNTHFWHSLAEKIET